MTRSDNTLSKTDIGSKKPVVTDSHATGNRSRKAEIELIETDIRSPEATTYAICSRTDDSRPWVMASPKCDLLPQYHMLHLGVAVMPDPFRIVRTHLAGSYFLASLSGEGRVLVDGKWLSSRPGHAFLLPPKTMHAFYTPRGKVWKFCWVRYQETRGQLPIVRANSPVLAKYDAGPLEMAMLGLYRECLAENSPPVLEQWLRLVHGYVQRFAQPVKLDERLRDTWEQVANHLAHPWTITELARKAHVSEKQFQRLCRRDLGRSPQQQLMWLRMRRASELLTNRQMKIQSVAAAVGYQNPFVFSTTFKRILGWSPSEYPGSEASSNSAELAGP
jgi:AraC-like DNA-binding protein